jgi:phage/plasmid primase-like uncharacterized protein
MNIPAHLIERAHAMRIEDEIARRGIKLVGRVDRCGPCPVCGGHDRFGVNIKKQFFFCRGCNHGGDVIALVQFLDGGDFREAVEQLTGEHADEPRKQNVHPLELKSKSEGATTPADALRLWNASADPRGTLAEVYLASRGLDLGEDIASDVLRWHPGIRAMLALFRDIRTDEPRAISRTFLDQDGRKIERKFFGPVGGCAIKLDADEEVLAGLHIAEGVETAMAARQLGLRPCWALGSAGSISSFPVLSGIDCLTILEENDQTGTSARVVRQCAAHWYEAGREVIVNEPIGGKDLNDALRRVRT